MLSFTAVVCTRNRASWARQAVESLVGQEVSGRAIEVLVVDNGSTDETPAVMGELVRLHDEVRCVVEPVPGLARARNLALEIAEGDIVAFLDDDAVAVPHWAAHHARAFAADPGVGATGGPIDLVWPVPGRPPWLPHELESLYSGLDCGPEEHALPEPLVPYGANMAVRASVVAEVGPFLLELGRSGLSLLSGEERELFNRIRAQGSAGGRTRAVAPPCC